MSLQKHAFSIIGAYLVAFIANLLIFQVLPVGRLSLGIVTLISMVALIIAILSERNLVIANAIEAPGVLAIASLLFAVTQPGGHWLSATLVGLVLAYDYRHTGAISTPIIAHIGALWMVWLYYIAHSL